MQQQQQSDINFLNLSILHVLAPLSISILLFFALNSNKPSTWQSFTILHLMKIKQSRSMVSYHIYTRGFIMSFDDYSETLILIFFPQPVNHMTMTYNTWWLKIIKNRSAVKYYEYSHAPPCIHMCIHNSVHVQTKMRLNFLF